MKVAADLQPWQVQAIIDLIDETVNLKNPKYCSDDLTYWNYICNDLREYYDSIK